MTRNVCACGIVAILAGIILVFPVSADVLPAYNYIHFHVANDAGVKFDGYGNNTYYVGFFGPGRGQNAHHITSTLSEPYGQVTTTSEQSGTFYITDTGGSGYADNGILMVAVNGTIPENFRLHIRTSGYNWTPKPGLEEKPLSSDINYVNGAVDEIFTKSDFIYGPQIWRPCGEVTPYPIHDGQDMNNATNTFMIMFIDIKAGQLGLNSGIPGLVDSGSSKVEYSVENPPAFLTFDSYAFDYHAKQGYYVIAWTNRLMGGSAYSGYSVIGPSAPQVVPLPGYANPPSDPDHDGICEDMNGNGRKDFNDVFIFFKQMTWISSNEPISAFDYNNNGRIDFNDIFLMFKEI